MRKNPIKNTLKREKKAYFLLMPRQKGSKSTVLISQHDLDMICGEGGLAVVSRRWLKDLGFDPDQETPYRTIGVHVDIIDGKEVWDFRGSDQ